MKDGRGILIVLLVYLEGIRILTGYAKRKNISLFYDGKTFAEILVNGKGVYKCSIADDILFHSIAEDENIKETYKIHQTKDFNFVYNSEALQS